MVRGLVFSRADPRHLKSAVLGITQYLADRLTGCRDLKVSRIVSFRMAQYKVNLVMYVVGYLHSYTYIMNDILMPGLAHQSSSLYFHKSVLQGTTITRPAIHVVWDVGKLCL